MRVHFICAPAVCHFRFRFVSHIYSSHLLTVCLLCVCVALGGEDKVKKESAQKDEWSLPWSKKDKEKVGSFVCGTF